MYTHTHTHTHTHTLKTIMVSRRTQIGTFGDGLLPSGSNSDITVN